MASDPSVLERAAHAGTTAGCGDCSWTVVADCPYNLPENPDDTTSCVGATHAVGCRNGILERLYLTDATLTYGDEGTLCVRPGHDIIPVGDDAAADVQRYLRDVRPPDLTITTRPRHQTLAGLPTHFTAAPPKALTPSHFGGAQVTETIFISPTHALWSWGDGSATDGTATAAATPAGTANTMVTAGATATATHTYVHGGTSRGTLTARWGASYTITFDGATFGPYAATGQLTRTQPFTLPVDTSTPVLVSH